MTRRISGKHVSGYMGSLAAIIWWLLLCMAMHVPAYATDLSARPSVLVIDAGCGDYATCSVAWLGDNPEEVAQSNGLSLTTTSSPAWWSGDGAPSTFVLGRPTETGATTGDDIAWATAQIAASGASPKVFVVASGPVGLSVRAYAEDLATARQSSRADLVGMALCGTPNNGYGTIASYPELAIWATLAQTAGLTSDDLQPQSSLIASINGGSLPSVCKVLTLTGEVGDLGFGLTDGVGTLTDSLLVEPFSGQADSASVTATISTAANLTGQWTPFTSSIDYPGREVDAKLAERLSAMECYEGSTEVQAKVQEFYQNWYADRSPVTYNANVLALDLSGSMNEPIDSGTKLAAAKEAAVGYLQAMQTCSELPQSAPMSVTAYGFNTSASTITSTYDDAGRSSINGMTADDETNIGAVLDAAVARLDEAPTYADRHILLLSDGASTEGQSNGEMLSGVVANAAERGIVVDTIGFGDAGESNADFLRQVSEATGGTYRQADGAYSLRVSFLQAYYNSLGMSLVDEELAAGTTTTEAIGTVESYTNALEVGLVTEGGEAPHVKLVCNGEALDESLYTTTTENGLTSVQCVNPPLGDYSMQIDGTSGSLHLFAVKQQGMSDAYTDFGEKGDFSLVLLIGAGVILVGAITLVVVTTTGKSHRDGTRAGGLR